MSIPGGHLSGRKKNVIMCDFDGTITIQDTAEWILDHHANGDWRALDEDYVQGKISLLDCMREQFSMVKTDRRRILEELDQSIVLRPGFPEMVHLCATHQANVIVVSAGLDFVIKHFMNKLEVLSTVSIYSARTYEDGHHIGFQFPSLKMPDSQTFKDDVVRQWRSKGYSVTYLGDGVPDAEACSLANYRFAVRGRRLEETLATMGLDYVGFDDFIELVPIIEGILRN